jgi:hypothetical protein
VDNKLAHPMGLPLLKAKDEIAAVTRRGKNISAPPAGYLISRQNDAARSAFCSGAHNLRGRR